jgi:SNF2 family DNA or RNA helicase
LMARTFDVLILDEVQSLKQRTTRRAKAIYGKHCDGAGGLIERAEHAWGLSGTIAPNGWAVELWSHLHAFGVIKMTEPGFAHRFCIMRETKWGATPVAHRNTPELKALLRPVYLRRRAEQVLGDLPPLQTVTTPIEADSSAILEAESSPSLDKLRAAVAADTSDDELLAALQHASGDAVARLRHGVGLLKVPGTVDLLRDELEADPSHKVVVFAVHRAVIGGLAEGLVDFGVVVLEGSTRPDDRQRAIDRFATDPNCRVFIAQIVAGGTGISLVASAHVILVEASWSPAENAQAIARCRRIGQQRPVLARYLYVPDSLDEALAAVLVRKSQMSAELEAA